MYNNPSGFGQQCVGLSTKKRRTVINITDPKKARKIFTYSIIIYFKKFTKIFYWIRQWHTLILFEGFEPLKFYKFA